VNAAPTAQYTGIALHTTGVRRAWLVGLIGFAITLAFAHGRSTPYNNYVLFANALLHGRIWIDWPGPYIDAVLFEGHRYIVNDPLPGILLLPLVAVWHLSANQTFLACVLAGVGTGAAWKLARNLGVSAFDADWLAAFMLLGTDLMWCAMLGDVWYLAHVSCAAFLLLALCELAGCGRPWLVAVFFALACASRFTVVLTLPAFVYWIAGGFAIQQRNLRALLPAALTWLPFALLWVAYNEVRWHVPWDSGHTIFFHQDVDVGDAVGEPFALDNVPMQLWSFFVQTPQIIRWAPFAVPPQSGEALTWTSPALALALFVRRPLPLVVSLWCAAVLASIPNFMYYVNGSIQFGMRHALDFEPFLLALMALAARRGLHWVWRILIAISSVMGIWGSWFWNTFYRPNN
jgi:hypothetical protein